MGHRDMIGRLALSQLISARCLTSLESGPWILISVDILYFIVFGSLFLPPFGQIVWQPLAQLRPHHLQENLLLLLQQPCLVLLQMMTVLAQWSLIKDKATQSTTVPFQEI